MNAYKSISVGVILSVAAGALVMWRVSATGHKQFALSELQRCPEAKTLLGEPIEIPFWGFSLGNVSEQGAWANTSWAMTVRGPRGKGLYDFSAEKHGGVWSLTSGSLHVGDKTVDVLACKSKPND
jgi:hypothetical protein